MKRVELTNQDDEAFATSGFEGETYWVDQDLFGGPWIKDAWTMDGRQVTYGVYKGLDCLAVGTKPVTEMRGQVND